MGYRWRSNQTQHIFHQASDFKRYKMRKSNIMSLLNHDQESSCIENFEDLWWYTGRYPEWILTEVLILIKFSVSCSLISQMLVWYLKIGHKISLTNHYYLRFMINFPYHCLYLHKEVMSKKLLSDNNFIM
jgi:hypothetical protein